jgi:hypothetical protein
VAYGDRKSPSCSANGRKEKNSVPMTSGPHKKFLFSDLTNMDSGFWLRKNIYKENKNTGKFGMGGNPIWNTFYY